MAADRRLLVSARRHSDRRVLADWKIAERGVGSGPRRRALSRARLRLHRVPDAVRHSLCRSAEPGPYQTPAPVAAPALQRTASRRAIAASKTRVNALMALRCVRGTAVHHDQINPISRSTTPAAHDPASTVSIPT